MKQLSIGRSPEGTYTDQDLVTQRLSHPPLLEVENNNSSSKNLFPILALAGLGAAGVAANSGRGRVLISNFISGLTEYGLAFLNLKILTPVLSKVNKISRIKAFICGVALPQLIIWGF